MYTIRSVAIGAKQLAATISTKMFGHFSARIGVVAKCLSFALPIQAFNGNKSQGSKCRTPIFATILAMAMGLEQQSSFCLVTYLAT
jgi:hypothetical protein